MRKASIFALVPTLLAVGLLIAQPAQRETSDDLAVERGAGARSSSCLARYRQCEATSGARMVVFDCETNVCLGEN